jgi:hypothetical protein
MDEMNEKQLFAEYHFASPVYWIEKPEYLQTAKMVSDEYLMAVKKSKLKDELMDELFPVVMTNSFYEDKRIADLVQYIGETSWRILSEQGYSMEYYEVHFMDFWAQEHYIRSSNEEHIHGHGAQITGFYILEAPENCSRISIHDPRPGKKQINMIESNLSQPSYASLAINYEPKPGNLYFLNAALPHGFSRHGSKDPLKFIHFNIGVRFATQQKTEII